MLDLRVEDCRTELKRIPDGTVQTCITSPPYWNLRDYGHPEQIGREPTLEAFIEALVGVFREVRRTLKPDGTLWVNMGDAYAQTGGKGRGNVLAQEKQTSQRPPFGFKPKDLIGMPWRLAFALQEDGWWLREDIIWSKPNPMPESVKDRCTRAHEYLFHLSRSADYFHDADAIAEPVSQSMLDQVAAGYEGESTKLFETAGAQDASATKRRIIEAARKKIPSGWATGDQDRADGRGRYDPKETGYQPASDPRALLTRNKRSVWQVPTHSFPGAHFATYPPALIRPCVLASSRPGDTVLDPFGGSGTTGMVAIEAGRRAILIEQSQEYAEIARQRCDVTPGMF